MAKKAIKSTEAPAATTPETTTPTENVTEVTVEKPVTPESTANEKFEQLSKRVADLTDLLKQLTTELKTVQKDIVKMVKTSSKKQKVRNTNGAKKTPSGFAKPTRLSDELCDFLGETRGTELARTTVTRRLNEYIKQHSLQDSEDKRRIHPDDKLNKILKVNGNTDLTYFNLQSAIKHHFVKAA
jgi:upstream activation factor subunit UAF30